MKRTTLDSSFYLIAQAIWKITSTKSEHLAMLNKAFSVFLSCIELFENTKEDFIRETIWEANSILHRKMSALLQVQGMFGASSTKWSERHAVSEIKVLFTLHTYVCSL